MRIARISGNDFLTILPLTKMSFPLIRDRLFRQAHHALDVGLSRLTRKVREHGDASQPLGPPKIVEKFLHQNTVAATF